MAKKVNARLIDPQELLRAGIDPHTGLPIKISGYSGSGVKEKIKELLKDIDLQDFLNRGTWYNEYPGFDGNLIERILYFRAQGMMFLWDRKYYFLPYTLNGTIDVYGRFVDVTPLPFNGSTSSEDKNDNKTILSGLKRHVEYDEALPEEFFKADGSPDIAKIKNVIENGCVLLHDQSIKISQTNIAREIKIDSLLDIMSEIIPYVHTALLNGTGVTGVRATTANEIASIMDAAKAINSAALTGKRFVPLQGSIDFQELAAGNLMKSEEYLLSLQALDNFRLTTLGVENGGFFEKQAHILQDEQNMNKQVSDRVLRDATYQRQKFCTIANSIWGGNMWYEPPALIEAKDFDNSAALDSDEIGTEGEEYAESV